MCVHMPKPQATKAEIKSRADLVKLLSHLKIISDKCDNLNLEGEILLHGIDAKDKRGWTAMHYAAQAGNLKAIQALLAAGANCLPENIEQLTPLHLAAMHNRGIALKALLKDPRFGDHIQTKDCYGRSPLKVALEEKAEKTLKILYERTHANKIVQISMFRLKSPRRKGKKVLKAKNIPGYGIRTEGAIIHTDIAPGPTGRLGQYFVINNLVAFLNREANKNKGNNLYYQSYEKYQNVKANIYQLKEKIENYQARGIAENKIEPLRKKLSEKETELQALGLTSADIVDIQGVCNGLAFLWQLLPHDEFQAYLELVLTWNNYIPGRRLHDKIDSISFLPESIKNKFRGKTREDVFRYIIQTISVFHQLSPVVKALQLNIEQGDRERQFSLIEAADSSLILKRIFNSVYLNLTEDQFSEYIGIFSQWPGLRIDLRSFGEKMGHAVALYVNPQGGLEYYDPNQSFLVKRFNTAEDFAKFYFQMNKGLKFLQKDNLLAVEFSPFKFYHKNQPLPQFEQASRLPQYRKKSANQFNPLHYLVLENNLSKITAHLENPENLLDIFTQDIHGTTPLMLAKTLGVSYAEILKILNTAMKKINLPEMRENFISALELAKANQFEKLEGLLEKQSKLIVLRENKFGENTLEDLEVETPFEVALNLQCPQHVIDKILEKTTDFDITKYLKIAIDRQATQEVLASLIAKSEKIAPLNIDGLKTNKDQSLFMYAISKGNAQAVELFMERGCRLDEQDSLGRTTLMLALQSLPVNDKSHEIIMKLMNKVNVDTANKRGERTIDFVLKFGSIEMLEALIAKDPTVQHDFSEALEYVLINRLGDDPKKNEMIIFLLSKIDPKNVKADLFRAAILGGAQKPMLNTLLNAEVPITPVAISALLRTTKRLGPEYVISLLTPPQWHADLPLDNKTALSIAVNTNPPNTELIRWLIEHNDHIPDHILKDKSQFMYIIEALDFTVEPDLFQFLIDREQNLATQRDEQGRTALMYALKNKTELGILKSMIADRGSDVSAKDNQGMTVLMHALENNLDLESIRYLIENNPGGSDLDQKNEQGHNALFYALKYRASRDLVKQFIQHSTHAELNQAFTFGLVSHANHENLQVLLDRMIEINCPLNEDLLIQAIKAHADTTLLEQLIPRSDLSVNDAPDQSTPLMCALRERAKITIIRHLLNASTVNQIDLQGMTPLMHALEAYHLEESNKAEMLDILKLLLANHAKVNAQTFEGKTVLGYAKEDPELLALLKNFAQLPPLSRRPRAMVHSVTSPSPRPPAIVTNALIQAQGSIDKVRQYVKSQPNGPCRVAEEEEYINSEVQPSFYPQKAAVFKMKAVNNPYRIFVHEPQTKDKVIYSISKKQKGSDQQYEDTIREACRLAIACAEPYAKLDLTEARSPLKEKTARYLSEEIAKRVAANEYHPPQSAPVIVGLNIRPRTGL